MAYYNTNHLHGEDLKKAIERASSQTEAIFLYIYNNHGKYGAFQMQQIMQRHGYMMLITSVRRALSTLKDKGELMILPDTVPGQTGKDPEHLYQLNFKKYPTTQPLQQGGLFDAA